MAVRNRATPTPNSRLPTIAHGSPATMAELSKAHENLCYAKIETLPTPNRFTETRELAGEGLSMFGGANGVFFIEEMRRGAKGTMQGIALCDVVRKTWDAFQAGDEIAAESMWNLYQPLVKHYTLGEGQLYWIAKEILRRRGGFTHAFPRLPAAKPDPETFRELDALIELLHNYGEVEMIRSGSMAMERSPKHSHREAFEEASRVSGKPAAAVKS